MNFILRLRIILSLILVFCNSNVFGMGLRDTVHQRKGSDSSIVEKDCPFIEVPGTQIVKKLYSLVISKNLEGFKNLIEKKIDVNQVITHLGETSLYIASALGCVDIVEMLLKIDANPNKANIFGWTPLHIAAFKGKSAVVSLLLDAKVEFDLKDKEEESTPLIFAAYNGHREIVKMLLEVGADSNSADYCDKTALYWAVFNNDIDMARMLIRYGAKVNKPEVSDKIPLHIAAFRANAEMIKLLLDAGADVEIQDKNGHKASNMTKDSGCIAILITHLLNKWKIS